MSPASLNRVGPQTQVIAGVEVAFGHSPALTEGAEIRADYYLPGV